MNHYKRFSLSLSTFGSSRIPPQSCSYSYSISSQFTKVSVWSPLPDACSVLVVIFGQSLKVSAGTRVRNFTSVTPSRPISFNSCTRPSAAISPTLRHIYRVRERTSFSALTSVTFSFYSTLTRANERKSALIFIQISSD